MIKFFKNLIASVKKLQASLDSVEQKKMSEVELVTWLQATWTQKQLDDLLLANQSVQQSLKQSPFSPKYLEQRDRIHHDINILQPIVLSTGVACAMLIERDFNVEFRFLIGRTKPIPKKEEAKPEPKSIILPGQ